MNAWVIEDNEPAAAFFTQSLVELGCIHVHRSQSVETARNKYQELIDDQIDLILLDLKLPDGMGIDLLPLISNHPARPAIVVCTGFGTLEDAVSALRFGVVDFLTKPVGATDLRAMMKRVATRQQITHGLELRLSDVLNQRLEDQDEKINEVRKAVARLEKHLIDPAREPQNGDQT